MGLVQMQCHFMEGIKESTQGPGIDPSETLRTNYIYFFIHRTVMGKARLFTSVPYVPNTSYRVIKEQ